MKVRRLIRIGIIAWVVGAVANRARRGGASLKSLARLGPDRLARGRGAGGASTRSRSTGSTGSRSASGGGHATNATAHAELAAVAAKEQASASQGFKDAAASAEASDSGVDLKIIEGIGPKIEGVLHQAGVTSFAGLAELGSDGIETILRDAGVRASPGTWSAQAKLAAGGEWDALAELQANLKGGRAITN